jgi:hypothetical protein
MAIPAALFSGLLGLICFLTALLIVDYSFLSACALYISVATSSFAWAMVWALQTFRSHEPDIGTA